MFVVPQSSVLKEQSIPKKIHFIFLSKSEEMPGRFRHCLQRFRDFHPDWEILLYNEDDAHEILTSHFPTLLDIYYKYPLNVQRGDILRVLLIYLYGGFYADLDMYIIKSLEPLRKFSLVLAEEKRLKDSETERLNLLSSVRIANYMFGSVPGQVFWLQFIAEACRISGRKIIDYDDVLESTGPGLLTNMFFREGMANNHAVLLKNLDRHCLARGHNEISCHFGNYAAHLHAGTWRWNKSEPGFLNSQAEKGILSNNIEQFAESSISPLTSSAYYLNTTNQSECLFFKNNFIHLSKFLLPIKTSEEVSEKVVIVCLIDCIDKIKFHNTNKYLLYCPYFIKRIEHDQITFINNTFTSIILPAESVAIKYRSFGVKIPIQIIPGALREVLRNPEEKLIDNFVIGCTANSLTIESAESLLHACSILKQLIPEIRLKILDPNRSLASVFNRPNNCSEILDYCTTVTDVSISTWMSDVCCGFMANDNDEWPLCLVEYIYVGIPIIVSNFSNYLEILDSLDHRGLHFFEITNEHQSLIDSIQRVHNEYENYCTASLEAASLVEDKYSEWDMKLGFQKIITQLQS